ncbi:MAG: FAD-binding oxidoreductase [Rhizobiaceae bacterium]|nr:FAD-binding oxidoreductase [Rhizobiaceae bacterium]
MVAERFDIAVIGAGIAGASVASELSARHKVVLIEREAQPGYHTTGRSAALFSETYGPAPIRALSRASAAFFRSPPDGFAETALVSPRGVMMVAREDQMAALDRLARESAGHDGNRLVDGRAARELVPLLREGYARGAFVEANAADIDVHALHHGYLRGFRRNGGALRTDAGVVGIDRSGASWRIEARGAAFDVDIVVNAAGAWADEIAALAGAGVVGLVPKRRTAMVVDAPAGIDPEPWPMVVDIDEGFYLKPDAGRLLISPADETPSPPCDAQPDEYDVALCVDRIETAFDLRIARIDNKWAGLRSFVADKVPVAGYDMAAPGFFWLAGQGGYGIQSAPALARAAAALVDGRGLPVDIADQGVHADALAPARLERAA